MTEKTVILNARMEPAVRDEFTAIINRIMKENDLKRAGDAYALLVEKLKEEQDEVTPDFKGQIAAIKANSKAIMSSVMAMNDIFSAFKENQANIEKKAQQDLVDKINELTLEKTELEKRCKTYQEKLEQTLQEMQDLKKQLESCQKQLNQQNQLEVMLNTMSELLGNSSGNDGPEDPQEAVKPLPGQMNITDYESEK